jgi:hypothetical protein
MYRRSLARWRLHHLEEVRSNEMPTTERTGYLIQSYTDKGLPYAADCVPTRKEAYECFLTQVEEAQAWEGEPDLYRTVSQVAMWESMPDDPYTANVAIDAVEFWTREFWLDNERIKADPNTWHHVKDRRKTKGEHITECGIEIVELHGGPTKWTSEWRTVKCPYCLAAKKR